MRVNSTHESNIILVGTRRCGHPIPWLLGIQLTDLNQDSIRPNLFLQAGTIFSIYLQLLLFNKCAKVCREMLGGYSQVCFDSCVKKIDGDESGETYDTLVRVIQDYLNVDEIDIQRVERQIVCGTNWKVTVKSAKLGRTCRLVVWQKLPAYGGNFVVTSCEDVVGELDKEKQVEGDAEGLEDPELDAAVAFALEALSNQSNSLAPFELREMIKASKGQGGAHNILMKVAQGGMAEHTVEVTVVNQDHGFVLSNVSYL